MGKLISVVIKIGLTLLMCKTVVSQTKAWISDKSDIWQAGRDACGANGSFAGDSMKYIETIFKDVTTKVPVWVYGYAELSPWYGYRSCLSIHKRTERMEDASINDITPAKCIKYCGEKVLYIYGIQGTKCYCIRPGHDHFRRIDVQSCNIISDSLVLKTYELFKYYHPSFKIVERLNRSCLASIYRPGLRDVIVSNCKDRHHFICRNDSLNVVYVSNYTTSWTEATTKCLMKNSRLSLYLSRDDTDNNVIWTGFKRDEELVWGKGLPEDGGIYKCLAVFLNGSQIIFSFHECNESLPYLCVENRTTFQNDLVQSVTMTTINDTDTMQKESTKSRLADHTGLSFAVSFVINLVIAGVFIAIYIRMYGRR